MEIVEIVEEALREYNQGNWKKSIQLLKKARAEIDTHIAWNLWKLRQKEKAAVIWKEVISGKAASNTTKASSHAGLGIYYAEKGNKEKALEHAQLAQKLLPEDATINQVMNLNACGISLAKIQELKKAENILKRVAQMNERLEKKSSDPETAKKASHQRAKNGYNLVALVYLSQGRCDEAIEELKNQVIPRYAKVNAETDLAAAYHRMAEIYENLEDYSNALRFEKMSLELWEKHPDDLERIETAKKISRE